MTNQELETPKPDKGALELRLRLLKDEIAAQANTFDQIDNKTGVALGFTAVVVGQVLSSVFRMTGQTVLKNPHPLTSALIFALANLFVLAGIACGAVSRWPRGFSHSVTLDERDRCSDHLCLLESVIPAIEDVVGANDKVLAEKSKSATFTYLFVALALVSYMMLTVFLYMFLTV